jgi:hypothetical protein
MPVIMSRWESIGRVCIGYVDGVVIGREGMLSTFQ